MIRDCSIRSEGEDLGKEDQERISKGEREGDPRKQVRRLVGSVVQAGQRRCVDKIGYIASRSKPQYMYNPVNSDQRVTVRNHRI